MDHGIANLMRLAGLSLADAVRMATINPARAAKLPERDDKVHLRVLSGPKVEVLETWLGGRRVA
jgi:N-acetylglucosamine-6-phosphate deacetylase